MGAYITKFFLETKNSEEQEERSKGLDDFTNTRLGSDGSLATPNKEKTRCFDIKNNPFSQTALALRNPRILS